MSLAIAAVSYANTLPFIYGIKHSGLLQDYSLMLLPPAECATAAINGTADIALIPVAELPFATQYIPLRQFCLSSRKSVGSVLLLSDKKIDQVQSVCLDTESRTSVSIVKILAKHYWRIKPEWNDTKIKDFKKHQADCDAYLVIGDKAFGLRNKFTYAYDLASEWHMFTSLPLVFALWAVKRDLSQKQILSLNDALSFGINHIEDMITRMNTPNCYPFNLYNYLTKNISYVFDEQADLGLQKFYKLAGYNEISA